MAVHGNILPTGGLNVVDEWWQFKAAVHQPVASTFDQ
jgi:hypothetical protein